MLLSANMVPSFRFRLLLTCADSLPHHLNDGFGATVAAADAGVRHLW